MKHRYTGAGSALLAGTAVLLLVAALAGGWVSLPFGASRSAPVAVATDHASDGALLVLRPEPSPTGTPITNIWAINADGSDLRRITNEQTAVLDFAPSRDGARIIYVARDGVAATALWRINGDATGRTRLTPPTDPAVYTDPAWSPAGDAVLYARRDLVYPGAPIGAARASVSATIPAIGVPRLWAMTPDGVTLRKIYGVGDDVGESPVWSPDGGSVAFRAGQGAQPMTNVAISDVMHDPVIVPTGMLSQVSWSPDGGWLACSEIGAGSRSQIAIVRADGAGKRPLFAAPAGSDNSPSWSPDGGLLAFLRLAHDTPGAGAVGGAFEVWTATPEGQLRGRLFGGDGRASEMPVWSPDSRMLAATRYTVAGVASRGVWVVGADGGGARELVRDATHPIWMPHR